MTPLSSTTTHFLKTLKKTLVKSISNTVKIVRANSVFGASASCSKILNDKKYFNTVKFRANSVFQGKHKVAQKSWMSKIYSMEWKFSGPLYFQGNSIFRASASCSKILNVKVYSIQWKISGQLCFQDKRKVAQKSWMAKNIFNRVKNSRATLFFSATANCWNILNDEKIFNSLYSVYVHLGLIRVIWASVVCNLDHSGDWL